MLTCSPVPSILILACLTLILSPIGCGGLPNSPVPTTDEMAINTANLARDFAESALKEKNPQTVKSNLEIALESINASADQYGGKSVEIQAISQELKTTYEGNVTKAQSDEALKAYLEKLNTIVPPSGS